MLDGILIINKPQGITSHDVVAKCRKILNTKKVGHTGTLDPLATGVLVVCVGKATKLVELLTCDDKIYEVEMKLGIQTDTGDITGEIVSTETVSRLTNAEEIIKSFVGKQKQIPPMYSAIKQNGVKLYELARKGIEVEREARDIEIFDISDIKIKDDTISFKAHVSKGTYIRVLCEDIAKKLGTCGTMTKLNRVRSGKFSIENACEIDEISEEKIVSMEKLFDKKITIEKDLDKLLNGMKLRYELPDGIYNLYTNEYIGIGKIEDNFLKREIIL